MELFKQLVKDMYKTRLIEVKQLRKGVTVAGNSEMFV
jgi:hypothetical protein